MARQIRKYRVKKHELAAQHDLKTALGKFNWKLLLRLAVSFIVIFSVFLVAVKFEFGAIYYIYIAATLVCAVCFAVFSHGCVGKIPEREDLSDTLTDAQKDEWLAKIRRDRSKSRFFLMLLIPLLLTFMIDSIYLSYSAGYYSVS